MGSNGMGCGAQCSRVTLGFLNIIFLVCGLAFIVLGGIFRFGSDKMKSEVEPTLSKVDIGNYNLYSLSTNLAIIFMVAGGIMILFSALGFVGACCLSRCSLVLYGILVGVVLIVELAGVILFFVMRSKFEDGVKLGLEKSIHTANTGSGDVKKSQQESLEYLFREFECCHVNGTRLTDRGSVKDICDSGKADYAKDCYDALKEWIMKYQTAFVAIGISVIIVEVLLIVCACAVYRGAEK